MSWEQIEQHLIYSRYAVRDPHTGERLESTYEQMLDRVFNFFDQTVQQVPELESYYRRAREHVYDRRIAFATPVLACAGSPTRRMGLYSCYPLGAVPDSTEGIMDYLLTCVDVYQHVGGCGVDFSLLRPQGTPVDVHQGEASGPVPFVRIFATMSDAISQGGRRRGALLGQLWYRHPDVKRFIHLKRHEKLPGINISVSIDDQFFDSPLVDDMAESIWKCGDPGLLCITNVMKNTPYPPELKDQCVYVNPCAEYVSAPFTPCNLLTVAAHRCDKPEDFEGLGFSAAILGNIVVITTLLNGGLGLPSRHRDRFLTQLTRFRPVGVGLTGLAEYFLKNLPSDKYFDLDTIEQIYKQLTLGTLRASEVVASIMSKKMTNVPPITWDDEYTERHSEWLGEPVKPSNLWNMTTTCQAPTGSVSIFLRALSTGIEPLMATSVKRTVYNTIDGSTDTFELHSTVLPQDCEIPQLSYLQEIETVRLIQKVLHTSASKTINVPEETTVEDIKEILLMSRDLKAISIYRKGSQKDVVTAASRKQPGSRRFGYTYKFTGPSNAYVTVNVDNQGKPTEVFINAGAAGSTVNAFCDGIGLLASLYLRKTGDYVSIVKKLRPIETVERYTFTSDDGETYVAKSLLDAVSFAVEDCAISNGLTSAECTDLDLCPKCQKLTLMRIGNCRTCTSCDYTTC